MLYSYLVVPFLQNMKMIYMYMYNGGHFLLPLCVCICVWVWVDEDRSMYNLSLRVGIIGLLVGSYYCIVPNKLACLNKRTPTLDFCQPYTRNHFTDLHQVFRAYS